MNENYIPLYRKYRPQTLEEVVGQEHIKKALTNAINLNKIAHAYLFTGPRGTGKTSTARIFAKSLNCVEGPTVKPCGKCENCIAIINSTPVDVIEIDAASNRSVEDAQNILEKVMYAPVNSRYKIYIIDEVHMLSTTAFNALLKTLEEPPKNVIFILATTEVHKVLDTIKSRCQRFDFKRITTDDISKHLRFIADKEKINITDDAIASIAKNSAGGMRDSIALLDQLSILDGEKAISTEDINALLGRISFDNLKTLTDTIIDSTPDKAVEILNNIYNSGNEPIQILLNLLDYIKNLLVVKTCAKEIIFDLTQLNDEQISNLKEQSEKIEVHQIIFLINKCSEYIKELKTSTNPQLWLEIGIIDLANLSENTKLIELQNRITRLEGGAVPAINIAQYKTAPSPVQKPEAKTVTRPVIEPKQSKPVDKPIKEPAKPKENNITEEEFTPPPKAQKAQGDDISTLWGQLLDNVQSVPTRALLRQWANPIKISKDEVELTIKNEMLLKQFTEGNKREMLIQAVDSMFSQNNSTVIVRLPSSNDKPVEVKKKLTEPKTVEKPAIIQDETDEAEIEEAQEEEKEAEKEIPQYTSTSHSDQVNMVKQLFDGKIID
ncbi:MAG: DNA polymerase III subunit gamma/tau [Clostridiaceae bacterium]|jgi:DNA polymerase III subunit gamma/tau|nr:DNA polymerase III subunit gamma/tau [Clostridiaceae bacterium]